VGRNPKKANAACCPTFDSTLSAGLLDSSHPEWDPSAGAGIYRGELHHGKPYYYYYYYYEVLCRI